MDFAAHRITVNAAGVTVNSLYGRPHIVAPAVLVKEKVLNGGFLPAEEIARSEQAWNSVAVTADHPREGSEFVNASTPERMDEYKFGEVYNAEYIENERALRGELWLDIQRALDMGGMARDTIARLAPHLEDAPDDIASLEAQGDGMLEVSTGYWFDAEAATGTHDGDSYSTQQRDIIPDHLAALPNAKGKCSVEDGCGAPRVSANQSEGDRVRWEASSGTTTYGIVVDELADDTDTVLVAVYSPDSDEGEWTTDDETRRVSADSLDVIDQFPPISTVDGNADDAATLFDRAVGMLRHAFAGADSGNENLGTGPRTHGTNASDDDHDCGCGCGGSGDCDNSSTMDYHELAEQTAFTAEQLRDMNDEQRAFILRSVNADDGDDEPENEPENEPEDDDVPDDGTGSDAALTREDISEIVSSELQEALAANQQEAEREQAIRTIVANSSKTEDDLTERETNELVAMAEVIEERQPTPLMGANYAGRGLPADGGSDDEDDGYVMTSPSLARNSEDN